MLASEPVHPLALAYLGYIQLAHEHDDDDGHLERGVHALRRALRVGDARVNGDPKWAGGLVANAPDSYARGPQFDTPPGNYFIFLKI